MNIGIITIGDELLIGQVVDTNSAWIAKEATEAGFNVRSITSICDKQDDIIEAIESAFVQADVILMSGGVGPTKDDITKETLCSYFNDTLAFNSEVLSNIERIFEEKGLTLNGLTREQAYVPQQCKVIQNRVGTAPITWHTKNNKVLISMPGVPYEMRWAMKEEVLPRLLSLYKQESYIKRVLYTYNISESDLAIRLTHFEDELPASFSLAYLPEGGVIRLRLATRGDHNAAQLEELWHALKKIVGNNLLVEAEEALEEVLINVLKTKQLSLSLAESCSGGYIAHLLTSIPGTSSFFRGGVVSYANSAKTNLLHVSEASLKEHGAVSQQVVEEMARGAVSAFNSTCAIAVSGIAGPSGGSDEKPVGTVWIATIHNGKIVSKRYQFGKLRENNIRRSAVMGIAQLLTMLLHGD